MGMSAGSQLLQMMQFNQKHKKIGKKEKGIQQKKLFRCNINEIDKILEEESSIIADRKEPRRSRVRNKSKDSCSSRKSSTRQSFAKRLNNEQSQQQVFRKKWGKNSDIMQNLQSDQDLQNPIDLVEEQESQNMDFQVHQIQDEPKQKIKAKKGTKKPKQGFQKVNKNLIEQLLIGVEEESRD